MPLPDFERIDIPRSKLENYLLSVTHSSGRGKALFFTRFGFTVDEWEVLAEALREHALQQELVKIEETVFGTRYVIEGPLRTPIGRWPTVRSVWFIDEGGVVLRFVTAYPK